MDYFREFDILTNIKRRVSSIKAYISNQRDILQEAEMRIRKKSGIMKNERISFNVEYDLSKFPTSEELKLQRSRIDRLIDVLDEAENELRELRYDLKYYSDYLVNHDVIINVKPFSGHSNLRSNKKRC